MNIFLLISSIISKVQSHTYGRVTEFGGQMTDVRTNLATNYALEYVYDFSANPYSTGMYGYGQPHAPKAIIERPADQGELPLDHPLTKKKEILYDRNGNQLEITEILGDERISLRKNKWDEENRLMAVDLNPSAGNTMHPMASYTYDAGGERIIKYHTEGFDVTSNAHEVSTPTETNAMRVMLYPSGLITAKVVKESETKMLTYTKHYYNGSQRISSKIGKAIEFGDIPERGVLPSFGMPETPTDFYMMENEILESATQMLKDVFLDFDINFALPQPFLLSNEYGQTRNFFTYENAETEQFWFHSDHTSTVLNKSLDSLNDANVFVS